MAYCTQSDVEKELPAVQLVQLADDDDDGVADAPVLTETIAQADAVVDGYLAVKYTVPLSPVPALVRQCSVAITIYMLFARRSLTQEARTAAYKDALAMLKSISAGTASLGVSPPVAEAQAGGPQASRTTEDRRLTMGRKSDPSSTGSLDRF